MLQREKLQSLLYDNGATEKVLEFKNIFAFHNWIKMLYTKEMRMSIKNSFSCFVCVYYLFIYLFIYL